ncbi:MAG: DUF6382 domain-containing protein [Eubacteriales bacterium]
MQPTYKRNLQKNYMILSGEIHSSNNYQLSMIRENQIKGLLTVEARTIDDSIQYYYDISGKQTVKSIYEKRKILYQDLKIILLEIHLILQQTKSYLLDESYLVLDPEYMYCNFEGTKLELLFYIDYENQEKNIFTKLAEYLIEYIDHEDEDAVSMAYQFYQSIRKENFILEQFLERIEEKNSKVIEPEEKYLKDIELRGDDNQPVERKSVYLEENVEIQIDKNQDEVKGNKRILTITYLVKLVGVASIFIIASIYVGIHYPFYHMEKWILLVLGISVFIGGILHHVLKKEVKEVVMMTTPYKRDTSKDKFETIIPSKSSFHNTAAETIMKKKIDVSHMKEENNQTVFMGSVGREQRILKGRLHNQEFQHALNKLPCIIGKAKGHADIVIKDESISRIHARITEKENKLYIQDLNSTNGTYKNGIILETNEEVLLEVKDEIQIGGVYLEYR